MHSKLKPHGYSYCSCIIWNISTYSIYSDIVAINRNYLHGSNHKTRMWISSSWINYLIWVKGWCIWLLRCRTVGTKTSETFQLEIIINFCGGTWSGKFTGLGHMSRKTPEVKIGLYSPLSQHRGLKASWRRLLEESWHIFRSFQHDHLRFGFTLLYHRQVALQLPFGDKNLGEDYDWCVALVETWLSSRYFTPQKVGSFSTRLQDRDKIGESETSKIFRIRCKCHLAV